jgi:hypothetical protein
VGAQGAVGATGSIGAQGVAGPAFAATGFSAEHGLVSISTTTTFDIGGTWTTTAPFYTGSGFDPTTGVWAVPATGKYAVEIMASFSTGTSTSSASSSPGPRLELQQTAPSSVTLLAEPFPFLDVNIPLTLTARVMLSEGEMLLVGDLSLTVGDTLVLRYHNLNGGVAIPIDLGGVSNSLVWSVHRLS